MDEPPFSLAFVMVKESFAGPAILFYLASDANKNKCQDHLKKKTIVECSVVIIIIQACPKPVRMVRRMNSSHMKIL